MPRNLPKLKLDLTGEERTGVSGPPPKARSPIADRHPDLTSTHVAEVRASLSKKCAHAGIAVPDRASIESSPFRAEIEQEWANMLGHQLPHLPSFADFWDSLDAVFAWLAGPVAAAPAPERAELGGDL